MVNLEGVPKRTKKGEKVMKGTRFIAFNLLVVGIILTLFLAIGVYSVQVNKEKFELTPEMLRAREYGELTDLAVETVDSHERFDFVKFGAYFPEDTDGDGDANLILGSYRKIGQTNTLYLFLSVEEGDGYLEGGKIEIINPNFTNKMSALKDVALKQNYISNNVKVIEFNNINAGTGEVLNGIISSAISNANDYSKEVIVRFTGDYVSNSNPENNEERTVTKVKKDVKLKIDWYGEAEASITGEYKNLYLEDYSKPYIEQVSTYEEKERPITFNIITAETKRELIPFENIITVKMPQLYGYFPTKVVAQNGTYNEAKHVLTITNNDNLYRREIKVSCVYPQEAYDQLTNGKAITFNLTSRYKCHNNPNLENPYTTYTASGSASVYFTILTSPSDKEGLNTEVNILNKTKVGFSNYLSKQNLLDAFNLEDDEINNMEYVVEWITRFKTSKVPGTYTFEIKDKDSNEGDLIDGRGMSEYINNKGIYFKNDGLVPNGATVSVYNADTEKLIKTFSYQEVLKYGQHNPYYFEEKVPRIKVVVNKLENNEDEEQEAITQQEGNTKHYTSHIVTTLQGKFKNSTRNDFSELKSYVYFDQNNMDTWRIEEDNTFTATNDITGKPIHTFTYEEMQQYNSSNQYLVEGGYYKFNINTVVNGPKDGLQDNFKAQHSSQSFGELIFFNEEDIRNCGLTGENTVDVYDVYKDSLIKTFTYDELLTYNSENPYRVTYSSTVFKTGNGKIGGPTYKCIGFTLENAPADLIAELYEENTGKIIKKFTHDEMLRYSGSGFDSSILNLSAEEVFGREDMYYFKSDGPVGVRYYHINGSDKKSSIPLNEYALKVYSIKEIDSKAIKDDYTLNQVNDFTQLKTNISSKIVETGRAMIDNDYVNLMAEENMAKLTVSGGKFYVTNQSENRNISIYLSDSTISKKWKNGIFLIEIPSQITSLKINNVIIDDNEVEVVGYDTYQIGKNYFIKIITSNEEPKNDINIYIDTTMSINPMSAAGEAIFKLYAFNENHNVYQEPVDDIYDINGNENFNEKVGCSSYSIDVLAPSSFVTLQTVSDYDDKDSVTYAPNIAEVLSGRTSAKINIDFANHFERQVENIEILGKVPAEGSLGSEYTTQMTSDGITIPEELENTVTVYYSEKADATSDLNDSSNGWTLKENTDFTKVKSYLITMGDRKVQTGGEYHFSYEISIPTNAPINSVAYGNHKVSFKLHVEDDSLLPITLTPSKVGIRPAKYYDINIVKVKEGTNKPVPGAKYQIKEINDTEMENELNRIIISNQQGVISLQNLRVNQEYSFKEINAPEDYELNKDEIKFKVIEENEELKISYLDDSEATFGDEATINDGVLTGTVEDEPKIKITLHKIDSTTPNAIIKATFEINGRKYTTNNGQLIVDKLSTGVEYTVKETYAEGYYLAPEFTFTLTKNDNGEYAITSTNESFARATITNDDIEAQVNVDVTFPNDPIELYNLQIEKVDSLNPSKKLMGARFLLKREDLQNSIYYLTDPDGIINVEGLYVKNEGNDQISGRYVLSEDEAPEGYVLNKEEVAFIVSKDENEKLKIEIENESNLETVREVRIDDETKTVVITLQNTPMFKLIKLDSETGYPLSNVGFVIYELESNGKIIDFAKDPQGNYIGTENTNGNYVVYTDQQGVITASIKPGTYKIMEIEFLEGYKKVDNSEIFTISGKDNTRYNYNFISYGTSKPTISFSENNITTNGEIEINYIEDWVRFAKGFGTTVPYNSYVKLMRTLDFTEDDSYENPNDTSFGDINGNGTIETIKQELTNENGTGCPIVADYGGTLNGPGFMGIFNGQGHELRNIYINTERDYVGLFGVANGSTVIKNITLTGKIINKGNYTAGIIGRINGNAKLVNVHNKCTITVDDDNNYTAGIAAYIAANTIMENCSNSADITGGYNIAGLIGDNAGPLIIENSENTGNITGDFNMAGVVGKTEAKIYIKDTHNNAEEIKGSMSLGGIVGTVRGTDASFINCSNIAHINATSQQCGRNCWIIIWNGRI